MWPSGSLTLSHTFSYWHNYVGKGEYQRTHPSSQAKAPFYRLIALLIMMCSVGPFAAQVKLASEAYGVVIVLVIKTLLDALRHVDEHRRLSAPR